MKSVPIGLILLVVVGVCMSSCGVSTVGSESVARSPAMPRTTLSAGPTARAPAIDGVLADACWEEAAMASGFVTYAGKWAVQQTTTLVTYDSEFLYLAFRCNEPTVDKLVVHTEQHDAEALFNDDRIEIFLDTNHDGVSYYHFVVNSKGAHYDAHCRIEDGQIRRDVKWDADVDIKTRADGGAWTIEMRVAFASFGGPEPAAGERWGINFAREQRTIDLTENSNWAMIPDGLNRPREFGDLTFGGNTELSYSVDAVEDRLGHYEIVTTIRNPADEPLSVNVGWPVASPWMTAMTMTVQKQLAPRNEEQFRISPTMGGRLGMSWIPRTAVREVVNTTLEISNADTGTVYESRKADIVTPLPMDVSLSRYYYRPEDAEAKITLTHSLDKAGGFEVEVHGSDQVEPLIAKKIACQPGKRDYAMSVDLTKLDWGRYVVTTHLTDTDGKRVFTTDRVFFKRAPRETPKALAPVQKASVRSDGLLLLNGKPFFPFSASPPVTVSEMAAASFNTHYWPQEKPTGMETPGAVAFERVGMPWITRDPDGGIVTLFPREEDLLRKVGSRIEQAKSDPRLYCWHIQYEAHFPVYRDTTPRTRLNTPEEYRKVSDHIKRIDPNHLTTLQLQLLDNIELMAPYRDSADIIELALPPSYARRMVPHFIENMKRTRELLGEGKPFVIWLGSTVPSPRYRTAEEIRCVSYLGLMHGAAGFVYHMGHGGLDPTTMARHWSLYQGLFDEIQWVFDKLATTSSVAAPRIVVEPAEIDHRVIVSNGRTYVVAVNTSPAFVEARIVFPDNRINAKRVGVPLENRSLPLDANGFRDTFTAFEPHVYELIGEMN